MHQPEDPKLLGRLSAFAEVAILLVGGSLAARALSDILSLGNRAERDALLYNGGVPHWLEASAAEAQWLLLRFGLTLALAWLICWWIGGPSRKLAGLSRGERSLGELVGFGIVMGLILAAPPFLLRALNDMFALGGENTPFWDLMAQNEWTLEFWLYMAASSFILVPIVEELFFRSYMLGRFRMHFTAGGAMLLSAAVFWVSHGQYLQLDPHLAAYSVMAFVSAAILAWSVVRTGSIAPAIIAHCIFNIPMTNDGRLAVAALALVLIIVLHKRLGAATADFFRTLATTREYLFLVALIAILAVAAFVIRTYEAALLPLLGAFVLLALIGLIRRAPWLRARRERPASN